MTNTVNNKSKNNSVADNKLKPEIKLWLAGGTRPFGPGAIALLELIEKTGSVSLASQEMKVSYSKALKVIAAAESRVGYKLVMKKQGGKHGGSTTLTDTGRELIARYEKFSSESKHLIQEAFDHNFDGFPLHRDTDKKVN